MSELEADKGARLFLMLVLVLAMIAVLASAHEIAGLLEALVEAAQETFEGFALLAFEFNHGATCLSR